MGCLVQVVYPAVVVTGGKQYQQGHREADGD